MKNPFKFAWQVLSSFVSRVHTAVTRTHANWWTLIGISVTIVVSVLTVTLQSGTSTQPYDGSATSPPSSEIRDAPTRIEDAALPVEGKVENEDPQPGSCDSVYASEKESQFRDLIDAEVGKCVPIASDAIKLYFNCTRQGVNRNILLKYQMRDALEGYVIRMSASYSGPEEVDLSLVEISTLNRGLGDACSKRGRSIR